MAFMELVHGLNRAVDSGKVRYIGISNCNVAMMRAAAAVFTRSLVTIRWNIIRFWTRRLFCSRSR
jgi:diketogulonate reductase-like aldo/keto reductase